jgi:hypothetical protein
MPEDQYHADPAPKPSMSSSFLAEIVISGTLAEAIAGHPRLGAAAGPMTRMPRKTIRNSTSARSPTRSFLGEGKNIVPVDAKNWKTKGDQEERKRSARTASSRASWSASFENAQEDAQAPYSSSWPISPSEHDTFLPRRRRVGRSRVLAGKPRWAGCGRAR